MPNPEDITDPTTAMNMALALMAKTFKLNYSTLTKNNQRISSNPRNRQIAQPGMNMGQDSQMQMVGGNGGNQFRQYAGQNVGNLNGYNDVQNVRNQVIQHAVQNPRIQNVGNQNGLIGVPGNANKNLNGDDNLVATRAEADLDEIEKVNANCILMANLQQASTSGTQSDKAPVYDSNGPVEVHNYGNCYDNEIFNMFTQEEQYTELLEPIPEPHQVPQNDNNVISEVFSVEQSGRTVEQHPTNVEETCVLYDSLYNNLATEVEKVNTVNRRMTLETHNWSSSAHQELHKIVNDEIFPIVNQVDARVQNFEIQFLKEAAKFVGDFKSLAKEADESLTKHKTLELEIEHILRAVVSQDIMFVVQNNSVVETSNLQTELERTKERFENYIIKKENEYAKLWNDWYKKCEEYKFDKISYDKAYNDMQQKIEWLQAQLGDLNGVDNTKIEGHSLRAIQRMIESPLRLRVNVKSKVVCATCKQCLTSINHDECLLNYVNGMTSRGKKQKANASINKKEKKQRPKVKKTKKVGSIERLASPKPSKPRSFLRWSPTERMFDQKGKIIASSESESQSDFSKGFQILLFLWQCLGTVHFEIDHVAAILGFGDLQWGNILITKITAFRRNACFVRNLEGVDLLKGNRSTNLYTINLYEMASASPICLMARASSTKSWLWHQRLSHLNFDTINDLAKNDLVFVLLKFKYHKEHLCPLCEQGKSKRASHPPKPVPNYRQRLHLLHMNLCGPMRIARINGKRKLDISFLYVFGALCYPKNDREDIGKFGAKGDIGFFIGYSADSCAFRVYNRRTKKTTETMNVLGLDLTYAPSTITTQQPTEGELDLLFEAMYNDYISGQSSTAPRTVLAAHAHQVRQAQMTSTSIADSAPTPTNSSYQATNLPNTSQDVDELNSQQQHV
uniref:Uncharacterized protein n=1 Tax=Tanacetum cinerariifolium TaxID=118510 RepID=A0A6L2KV83_TANCI|nr:hypothetical protein [Tanacetum cinerariifolium]